MLVQVIAKTKKSISIRTYLCSLILAGLSRQGARQYDATGEMADGEDVVSMAPTPPRLSTSPPCLMYTAVIITLILENMYNLPVNYIYL